MISGWTEPCITDDTSRHCYEIVDTRITWVNASELCKRGGGHLVTIESVEEQTFITDLVMKKKFNVPALWIGSDKLHPEEQRAWANGEKFSYVNWAKGEPNNLLIDEDCVEMRTDNITWHDVRCAHLNGYICENSRT
ncbi:hypothetical protein ACJMK2_022478 [Sinanodonta woodiana]|uniref:C-type lectin domain-containing protein n=1 Tax=Sinanodonta woodiana TaxID=1069815 RepID=A0ABD3TL82_SINWO